MLEDQLIGVQRVYSDAHTLGSNYDSIEAH